MRWPHRLSLLCFLLCGACRYGEGAPVIMEVPPKNPHFVGRAALLQKIHQEFAQHPLVVLTGGPGFGKSQMAKHYAHEKKDAYAIIWWFKGDHTLPHQMEVFAGALNVILPPKEQLHTKGVSWEKLTADINRTLRHHKKKCLFIFDDGFNFDKLPAMLGHLPDVALLITTRYKTQYPKTLTVDKLTPQESAALLRHLLPHETAVHHVNMATYFKDHPLTLVTAASFLLANPSVSMATYLASHDMHGTTTAALGDDATARTTSATLKLTLQALHAQDPVACQALKFLTLLHHTQIPFAYLEGFLKIQASSPQVATPHKVISVLYGQSLVEVQKNNTPHLIRLSMHELLHHLMKDHIPTAEKKVLLDQAVAVIAPFFAGHSDAMCQRIMAAPEHLLHAKSILKEAHKIDYVSVPLISLSLRVLDVVLCGYRDFDTAKAMLASITTAQEKLRQQGKTLPLEDQAFLEMYRSFFAGAYLADHKKSLEYGHKALSLLKQLPQATAETIRMVASMAQSYLLRGELTRMEELIQQGIPLLKRSQADAYNALFVSAWARLLSHQGKLDEAIDLLNRYDPLFVRVAGQGHPTVLYALLEKAQCLAKKGDKPACAKVLDQLDKLLTSFFGDRQTDTRANFYVVQAMNKRQQPKEALALLRKALGIYDHFYGGTMKGRIQALAYQEMGNIYVAQKKY